MINTTWPAETHCLQTFKFFIIPTFISKNASIAIKMDHINSHLISLYKFLSIYWSCFNYRHYLCKGTNTCL